MQTIEPLWFNRSALTSGPLEWGDRMGTLQELRPEGSGKRRVLVVEDNLDSVHSMAYLVKMMGHEVRFAINGFAAMAIAREYRPDVVLLDLGLPDFNGCEVARQLRYEEALRNTRFICSPRRKGPGAPRRGTRG